MTRPKMRTLLICVGMFIFFLMLQSPFQNFRGHIFKSIYDKTHIWMIAEEVRPSFFGWPGITMRNVDVTLPLGDNEISLSAKKLVFKVALAGIWPFAPSLGLKLRGLRRGGDLTIWYGQKGKTTDFTLESDGLSLEQIAVPGFSEPIAGFVDIESSFSINGAEPTKSNGEGELSIRKLKMPPQNIQGFVLPSLLLNDVKARVNVKNGVVEISTFQFGNNDSDLKGNIAGNIRLSTELNSSFLNLVLTIQVSPKYRADPKTQTLLSLLEPYKTREEEFTMRWSATLHDLTHNIINVIPQRVEH